MPEDFTMAGKIFNRKIDGICLARAFFLYVCVREPMLVYVNRSRQPDCVETISKSCRNKLYFFMVSPRHGFCSFRIILAGRVRFSPANCNGFHFLAFGFSVHFNECARKRYALIRYLSFRQKTFLTFFIFVSIVLFGRLCLISSYVRRKMRLVYLWQMFSFNFINSHTTVW